jgi:hypothetical protein
MAERKRPFTKADVNGFDVPGVPAKLPESEGPKPSPKVAIRAALRATYDDDEVLRQRLGSLDNKSSQTGNYHWDKAFAAATLLKYALENGLQGLDGDKPLAKLKAHLPEVLKEFKLDRQSRFRQAIEDGRKARAAQTDEPQA